MPTSISLFLDGNVLSAYPAGFSGVQGLQLDASGLFETILIVDGMPCDVEKHQDRLKNGWQAWDEITFDPWLVDAFPTHLNELIAINQIGKWGRGRFKIFYDAQHQFHWAVEAEPYDHDPRQHPNPQRLCLYELESLHLRKTSGFKVMMRKEWNHAFQFATANGFDDALLFSNGMVSETSVSNIFMRMNNELFTPPLADACLSGVMRLKVKAAAAEMGFVVREKSFSLDELLHADEVFTTNVVRGVWAVGLIGERIIPTHEDSLASKLIAVLC